MGSALAFQSATTWDGLAALGELGADATILGVKNTGSR